MCIVCCNLQTAIVIGNVDVWFFSVNSVRNVFFFFLLVHWLIYNDWLLDYDWLRVVRYQWFINIRIFSLSENFLTSFSWKFTN